MKNFIKTLLTIANLSDSALLLIAVKNSVTIEKIPKSQNCNEMLKIDYINKKFIVQIDHLEHYLLNFEFFEFEQDWRLRQQIVNFFGSPIDDYIERVDLM